MKALHGAGPWEPARPCSVTCHPAGLPSSSAAPSASFCSSPALHTALCSSCQDVAPEMGFAAMCSEKFPCSYHVPSLKGLPGPGKGSPGKWWSHHPGSVQEPSGRGPL